jgi:methylglyoxal/glyoxal reductase
MQIYTTLNTGQKMPLLGLGVYDMYQKEAEKAVLWALETGYRLIDTAAMYRNETEIGNAIRASNIPREDIFLTTKVNNTDQGFDSTLRGFDASMRKLNCEYLDLYLVHWPIKEKRKETWLALERLYTEKRVKAIGSANYLPPFLDELETYASVVPAVNQVEFSPYLFLEKLMKRCQKEGTVLQAYTPLLRGKRFDDPKLVALSKKYGKTPAQIILRWALQHGVSTIPKSANLARIKENFDVFDFEIAEKDIILMNGFDEGLRLVDDPMTLL